MSAQPTNSISKLAKSKVLIFGGSSGIGHAVAEALLEQGAAVTISSSSAARVDAAAAALAARHPGAAPRIAGRACDLADAATADANIAALFESVGRVDHVVYTAGDALSMVPITDVTGPMAVRAGQVRFFAPLLVAKHATRHLSGGPRASITFTGGVVAERPIPGWPLVSAYAAALQGLVRALAVDLGPVRVNMVQPGVVDTNLYATSGIPEDVKGGLLAGTAQKLPIGRVVAPQDVAEAFVYLIRSEGATGEVVNANGGHLIV